jgi:hypothetical protein
VTVFTPERAGEHHSTVVVTGGHPQRKEDQEHSDRLQDPGIHSVVGDDRPPGKRDCGSRCEPDHRERHELWHLRRYKRRLKIAELDLRRRKPQQWSQACHSDVDRGKQKRVKRIHVAGPA